MAWQLSEILKGLKGEPWEEALIITRSRDRGQARVIDEPSNLQLILANRNDVPMSSIDSIKKFLKNEYNLDASNRSIKTALSIIKDELGARMIKRICEQDSISPFPSRLSMNSLMQTDLFWLNNAHNMKMVAEALLRLGYERRRENDKVVWVRKNPA